MRALLPTTILTMAMLVVGMPSQAQMTSTQQQGGSSGGSQPMSNRASNIGGSGVNPDVAPSLPAPDVAANASAASFLHAAQRALIAGRSGEAQEALERAQTRLLDRSVPLFQTNKPIEDPAIRSISAALHALGAGDRAASMQQIEVALKAVEK